MYPVSTDYKNKIKENNRLFECKIQIEHSQGTLYLGDKDLVAGTLTYTEASQTGEEFTVGGTVASDISFTILNKPEYENIVFMGATVFVNIGLQVKEGIDAHFLQPSQPSKMKGYEEKWEYVPLGRFNIDDVNRQRNTIQLKAIDNMINLDKSYSLSKLSYPATLYQIYVNICNVADIPVGTTNFPNKDYVVKVRPDGDLTLRDVLGYVAELAGCFAKCNRHGTLELKWYEQTDIELEPMNRFNFKPSDDVIQIKGVMATVDGTTYLAGSEDYAIDLTENPLLQGDYETILPVIYNNVKDTVFTPYTSDWQGNPAIQAGDIIKQIDRDGKEYNTLVTKSVYKYRGKSILEAKGLPEISRGYKGSTNRKLAEIRRKIDVEVGDKLTTLEEQQLQATELIANMLGGYAIKTEEAFYIADNEDLQQAQKVWKWGIGGFGYSENGVDGPYTTAVTADGSIVAMLVAANIITADMIQAGILQSQDGGTWINLNDGSFNFKDKIKFVNNKFNLSLAGTDANDEVDGKIDTAKSEINIITDAITTRVSATESNVSTLERDTSNLKTRMSSAETKITPSAITSTVESNSTVLAKKTDIPDVSGLASKSEMTQTADAVRYEFKNIKNADGTDAVIETGNIKLSKDGIKVTHTGLGGQYSEMRADGFIRKWQYGEAEYLNGLWVAEYRFPKTRSLTKPNNVVVNLPESFTGRTDTEIFLAMINCYMFTGGLSEGEVYSLAGDLIINLDVAYKNFYANPPKVEIENYTEQSLEFYDGGTRIEYYPIDFLIMAVGK